MVTGTEGAVASGKAGVTTVTDERGFITQYQSNGAGNLTRIARADGSTVDQAWNADEKLVTLKDADGFVSNFVYDLYFYIDNPTAPQALEFDVNQGYDDTSGAGSPQRWTWGSECNFKGETPPQWDIWDDANGVWKPTGFPCGPFQANTWNHLS